MDSKRKRVSPSKSKSWVRLVMVFGTYLVITVLIALIVGYFSGGLENFGAGEENGEISLTELIGFIEEEKIEKVVVEENELRVSFKDGTEKISRKESGSDLFGILEKAGIEDISNKVKIEVAAPGMAGFLGMLISNLLPILVMILFFLFLFRQAGKSAGGIFDFGKSRAKTFDRAQLKVSFKDAAGVAEAKKELEEVVDFLKNPNKYLKLGARIPKGVLLIGPAGTGKTLLARAVANEAQVPFYSMAGSEFMEMLVGVGASRVRDLFKRAKDNAPALIFIDEIESIGRHRGRSVITSHGEQEQTLNQILVEMDGFAPNENVIVIGATNRPDLLDPALTRPGRFDRTVVLQLPDIEGRRDIIKIHMRNKPMSKNFDLGRLAKRTVGFSGADLENMLNEAAILAAAKGQAEVGNEDIEEAVTKVKLGRKRRRVQSARDKKMTAYHEAGHAIVTARLPGMDPVYRVSIVSRGIALGFTEMNPEEDRSHQTKTNLVNQITALLGGRAAEQLVIKDMTVGAGNDLEKASFIAYKMVTEYGMSSLGPIAFKTTDLFDKDRDPFFERSRYSEEMAAQIDQQVKKIIDESYQRACQILERDQNILDRVVEVLLKEETIEQEEFDKLLEESS